MSATAQMLIAFPLWQRARASLARCVAAIGAPAALAALRLVPPALKQRASGWLLLLEHVVRKLLLAEAAALARAETARKRAQACAGPRVEIVALRSLGLARHAPPPPARAAVQRSARNSASAAPDPERPESWRVRFSLAPPRDPKLVCADTAPRIRAIWDAPAASAPPPAAAREPNTAGGFRLARRLEALRRVLGDPLPHARRLVRSIAGAARRFPEIATRYLFAPVRTSARDEDDPRLSIDAIGAAIDAPKAFADTS